MPRATGDMVCSAASDRFNARRRCVLRVYSIFVPSGTANQISRSGFVT
jgi:hypothetical protein